jgi:SAM-dependent methyltransferase
MIWKFDKKIAEIYLDHVKGHIPDYDKIISISIDMCEDLFDKENLILDIGCANGRTLEKLNERGFLKLIGTDTSQDMLDTCDKSIATYFCTSKIVPNSYSVILANWVLHFNTNKKEMLTDCYNNLLSGGALFLSDKTLIDDYTIYQYYKWKNSQGVSWDEIKDKENSLTGQMLLESPEWYFITLKEIGFKKINLLNGSFGFITVIAFKD